jgi:integrase
MASIDKRPGGRYRVRWRASPGRGIKEQSRHFVRKVDANRFKTQIEASLLDGSYVDPAAGRVTFDTYAESWRQMQVHRPMTAAQVEANLRRHVLPRIGDRPLSAVRTSEVQQLVKGCSATLAPSTVELVYGYVNAVFAAAVDDRVIARNPCRGIKLPAVERVPVVPLSVDTVFALTDAIDQRYAALVTLGAGTGLRISEALAVTADRIDRNRRTLLVDRQLLRAGGGVPVFGPVKDRKNRSRTIPLPNIVVTALAEHQLQYGLGPEGLIFSGLRGGPIPRSTFSDAWRVAAGPLGLAAREGFHQLRHFYASALIEAGESVKVIQSRLGHTSATMTLDIYGHLWPDTEDRTRGVIDAVLRRGSDQVRTTPDCAD